MFLNTHRINVNAKKTEGFENAATTNKIKTTIYGDEFHKDGAI